MKLTATFHPQQLAVSIQPVNAQIKIGQPIARDLVERDPYTGDYEILPTAELITLETKDKRMLEHVRILPIPSNYGLITWNGSTLTVS